MRWLRNLLFIFLAIHFAGFIIGGLTTGRMSALREYEEIIVSILLVDVALSGLLVLVLAVLGVLVLSKRLAAPPNIRQLIWFSLFHVAGAIAVAMVVLQIVFPIAMDLDLH